jgi:hypothetical protein
VIPNVIRKKTGFLLLASGSSPTKSLDLRSCCHWLFFWSSTVDVDGFAKLNDANNSSSKTQAEVADMLADIPQKLAQADLTEQKAIAQLLENVAKAYDIQWDIEAHSQLRRMINISLREARLQKTRSQRFEMMLQQIGGLSSQSPHSDGVRDGWIAFNFLSNQVPPGVQMTALGKAMQSVTDPRNDWGSCTKDMLTECMNRGGVVGWAIKNNYYPILGTDAWAFISIYLTEIGSAAEKKAALVASVAQSSMDAALVLCKIDWDRLKQGPPPQNMQQLPLIQPH